jgi:NADH:ubiquinone oxidoreductase subunit 3 (subunit A)
VGAWSVPVAMLLLVAAMTTGAFLVHRATAVNARTLLVAPFLSGWEPTQHAVSRFHARWYAVTLLFLAFDVEMLFMYPWVLVVAQMGSSAIIEMFAFLVVLLIGVLYAWREGALTWA